MEDKVEQNKGKTILLVVMMIVVILISGYIVYDRIINKSSKPSIIIEEEEDKIDLTKLSKELMQSINLGVYKETIELSENSLLQNYFYQINDKVLVSEIKSDYLIDYVYRFVEDKAIPIEHNEYAKTIDANIIKEKFYNVYGDNVEFDYQESLLTPKVKYNPFDEKYYSTYIGKLPVIGDVIRKINKVDSTSDSIYIYEKSAFILYNEDENTYDVYKDYLFNTKIVENISYDNILDKISKFNEYKYTFKKDDKNKYNIYSVEFIK